MNGKTKMMAVAAVVIVVAAAVGAVFMLGNDNDRTLSVVYLKKSHYEELIVGDKKGFFDELDFKVDRHYVTGSGKDAVDALIAGTADIAATGEGPAVNAIEAYGEDIVVLCSFAVRTAAQVWVAQGSLIGEKIVVEGKTPQEIADQLKDSKLKAGVIEGSSTERLFKRWLDEFEVSYSTDDSADIRLVYLTGSTLVQSFATGDIDLLAGSQPYPSTAIENANGVQIGSSADIGVYSSSVLITTKDVYEKKTDMIKEFVAAVKKSTEYVEDHLEECIDICADTIGWAKTVQAEVFANSEPRVEFNDRIVDIMFAAAKEGVTRETIADACPLDMKEYLEQLYA